MHPERAVRVAGIDCGTNSVRLLIAERAADESFTELTRQMRIVRLGAGVDRTGRLDPAAIERTRLALAEYAELISSFEVTAVRMVATSATRDATNRGDFVAMVVGVLGIEPEVISGTEEAALSFAGASNGAGVLPNPLLVVDIGGGSTELVLGTPGSPELDAVSLDIGCVRITERYLHNDPPTAEQVAAARAAIAAAIEGAPVPIATAASFVGVAGTVTTMAAIIGGLSVYDPTAIHGSVLPAEAVHELTEQMLTMTHDQRAAWPVMHPGRVDVIVAGALILSELIRISGVSAVIASEHDILDAVTATAH